MKKILYPISAALLMILLGACESGGKFRVVNRCTHNLYVQVGNQPPVTIPGDSEHSFEISTDTQHIFNPDASREVPVTLVGETYQIFDDVAEAWTDSTTVVIEVGKTLSAYIDPNRASVKIVNQSSDTVSSATVYKHNFIAPSNIGVMEDIGPSQERFLRVDYATPNNNFYYYVQVQLENGTIYTYGGEETILQKDQQLLITLTDPEENY